MAAIIEANPAPAETAATALSGQYLIFMLSGEAYALEITHIREIIQFSDLTAVPMMPGFIRGVLNLRGKVVPVVDLNARFGRGETEVARRTSVIIIELDDDADGERQNIGVMVDSVNEVVEIAAADIEPPPTFGAHIRPDFISGMARQKGKFIVVLNLVQVLSVEEMTALGQAIVGSTQSSNGSDS